MFLANVSSLNNITNHVSLDFKISKKNKTVTRAGD